LRRLSDEAGTVSAIEARAPAVASRQVVGRRLPGDATTKEIRALLVGARIDTGQLTDFVDAEELGPGDGAVAFVFPYGVVVIFGAGADVVSGIVEDLRDHVIEPVGIFEVETAIIEVAPFAEEQVQIGGRVLLREASTERLLLTATVLARSVILARDETLIGDAFERIEPLVRTMRTEGRAGMPARGVMQQIGEVLSTRHRMVGRAQIGEKPDLLWDHPELERLYARLEDEFELDERARAIDRKLDALGDAADILLNLVQEKRAVRMELAIIALIAFEIVLTLYEKLVG
jgi:uncharacterized Rmd1/YagE family protein